MHDSLTSQIFQRLGQEHTEILGIAENIHSLGSFGVERREASPLFSPSHKKIPLKHAHFQTYFMLQFHCSNMIQ